MEGCPEGYLEQHLKGSSLTECVSECRYYIQDDKYCVETCDSQLYIKKDFKGVVISRECVNNCSGKVVYPAQNGMRLCAESCSHAMHFLRRINLGGNVFECTRKCDSGFYTINSTGSVCYFKENAITDCSEVDSENTYNLVDDESQMVRCVSECPEETVVTRVGSRYICTRDCMLTNY